MKSISRAATLALVCALATMAGAASASAATPTCSASVLSLHVLTVSPLNVGQSGSTSSACKDDNETVALNQHPTLGALAVNVTGGASSSGTAAQPTTAEAKIANPNVSVGGLAITSDLIDARVTGCVGHYTTSGEVTNLKIGGTPVLTNGTIPTLLGNALVKTNVVTVTSTGATRDAVTLSIPGVLSVVLGHAQAANGTSCASGNGGNGGGGNGSGGNGSGGNGNGGNGNGGNGSSGGSSSTKPNNGTNASRCAHLKMWFVPRKVKNTRRYLKHAGPKSVTTGVEHGVHRVTRGMIVNCKGKPIRHAKIDVYHVVKGHKLKKTGLRSRNNGLLTDVLQSNLHTRNIVFQYRPNLKSTKVASKVTLKKVMKRHGRKIY
jgi:hypothetical protein